MQYKGRPFSRQLISVLQSKGCLLADLKCQWRWASSERQLSDGLTKIGARQAFVERYSGSHVQLVASMNFMAAKQKSKEERASAVAETRQTKSEVAQALIALVMA